MLSSWMGRVPCLAERGETLVCYRRARLSGSPIAYTLHRLVERGVTITKVFWRGRAVKLPKELRFPPDIKEVEAYREGEKIVLEPILREDWPEDFWKAFEGMPEDFERP